MSSRNEIRLIISTDVGKDADDAIALVVAGYMHRRFGSVKIECVITTLTDPFKRALVARSILDTMGLYDTIVGPGSDGTDDDHREQDYEYDTSILRPTKGGSISKCGRTTLVEALQKAVIKDYKVRILCLGSLRDIAWVCEHHSPLVSKCVESFYVQGSVKLNEITSLCPDSSATNNRFDMEAASKFYQYIGTSSIRCLVATKHASLSCSLSPGFIDSVKTIPGSIPCYLHDFMKKQFMKFYLDSCVNPYTPTMDKKWWIQNITSWPGDYRNAPEDDTILKYVKVPVYDLIPTIFAISEHLAVDMGLQTSRLPGRRWSGFQVRIVGESPFCTQTRGEETSRKLQQLIVAALSYLGSQQ